MNSKVRLPSFILSSSRYSLSFNFVSPSSNSLVREGMGQNEEDVESSAHKRRRVQ